MSLEQTIHLTINSHEKFYRSFNNIQGTLKLAKDGYQVMIKYKTGKWVVYVDKEEFDFLEPNNNFKIKLLNYNLLSDNSNFNLDLLNKKHKYILLVENERNKYKLSSSNKTYLLHTLNENNESVQNTSIEGFTDINEIKKVKINKETIENLKCDALNLKDIGYVLYTPTRERLFFPSIKYLKVNYLCSSNIKNKFPDYNDVLSTFDKENEELYEDIKKSTRNENMCFSIYQRMVYLKGIREKYTNIIKCFYNMSKLTKIQIKNRLKKISNDKLSYLFDTILNDYTSENTEGLYKSCVLKLSENEQIVQNILLNNNHSNTLYNNLFYSTLEEILNKELKKFNIEIDNIIDFILNKITDDLHQIFPYMYALQFDTVSPEKTNNFKLFTFLLYQNVEDEIVKLRERMKTNKELDTLLKISNKKLTDMKSINVIPYFNEKVYPNNLKIAKIVCLYEIYILKEGLENSVESIKNFFYQKGCKWVLQNL